MVREALTDDINIEMDETEEGTEEKKRRVGLTAAAFYEALLALLQAQAKITDDEQLALPPTLLIAEVDGQMTVHICEGRQEETIYTALESGIGGDLDEAFTALIEKVQKSVEDKRRTKFSDIDELMKKGGSVLRRVKSKKKDAG